MLPTVALVKILPRLLALAALLGLAIGAAAHAGVLVDWVVSAVVWIVRNAGGWAMDIVSAVLKGIVEALGRDVIGL